jgi:KAP family P-loop domain
MRAPRQKKTVALLSIAVLATAMNRRRIDGVTGADDHEGGGVTVANQDQGRNTSAISQVAIGSSSATQLLSDRPLISARDDSLGFAAYADALAGIIGDSRTDTPLTIAISAEWGAGKTSLAKMIEGKLLDEQVFPRRQNITCWFNAWMHDDAPNLGSAFAAMVAKDINRYRPIWLRLVSPLPSAFYSPKERWHRRILVALMSFLIVALAALVPNLRTLLRETFSNSPVTAQINGSLSGKWASAAVLVIVIISASRLLFGAAQATARFVDSPQSEAAKGSMQSVHDQLADLIRQAASGRASLFRRKSFPASRLIIFVDDLERCKPPRAVDVCEVANQLLSVAGVVIVIIGDMQAIASSATIKYLPKESGGHRGEIDGPPIKMMNPFRYGRAYLEKIIQIQFNMPVSRSETLQQMLMTAESKDSNERDEEKEHVEDTEKETVLEPHEQPDQLQHDQDEVTSQAQGEGSSERVEGKHPVNATPEFMTRLRRLKKIDNILGWLLIVPAVCWFPLIWLVHLRWWAATLIAVAIFLAVAIPGGQIGSTMENMTGRKGSEIDNYIREISQKTDSIEGLRAAVQSSSAAKHAAPEFVDQRIQSFLVEESNLRQRAELTVRQYVPSLPRGAKRAINQLRVALAVAERRGMFASTSPLQPEHLGKWVILGERWPELAIQLTLDPHSLGKLESLGTTDMKSKISAMAPNAGNIDELCNLLQSEPRLQSVLDHLVRFEPWPLTKASVRQGRDGRDSTDEVRQQEVGDLGQVVD